MGNTGKKVITLLRKKNLTTGVLTGTTKPNIPGDPDYVPPQDDLVACPVPVDLTCPVMQAVKKGAASIQYEVSLPESVLKNPAFFKLEIVLKQGVTTIATQTFLDFDPNYFSGLFETLTGGLTYTITVVYRNAANAILHSCPAVASVTLDSVITWERMDPACQTTPTCEPGWTLDETGTQCEQVSTMAPNAPTGGGGTPGTAIAAMDEQWNNGGGALYLSGFPLSGDGTVDTFLTTPHLWVNGNFQWDSAGRNTIDSRMNAAGVWVASNPTGEWIGFARQVTTSVAKTVYIGMAADNMFRFALNGVDVVNNTGNTLGGSNFNFWNIYPVLLPAGVNFIEMYGKNSGGPGGFGVEIYDCTRAQLLAVTTEAELNAYIIFSSRDVRGQTFDLGVTVGYNCNPGWVLDNSDPDPSMWTCKMITRESPTLVNTGLMQWINRRRLASGVPDGYTEANDLDGIGPFFPPEEDDVACPPPEGTTQVCVQGFAHDTDHVYIDFEALGGGGIINPPVDLTLQWIWRDTVNLDGAWHTGPDRIIPHVGGGGVGTPSIEYDLTPFGILSGVVIDGIEIIILSITPDQYGTDNYTQCTPAGE
jgi:hypothetical protein